MYDRYILVTVAVAAVLAYIPTAYSLYHAIGIHYNYSSTSLVGIIGFNRPAFNSSYTIMLNSWLSTNCNVSVLVQIALMLNTSYGRGIVDENIWWYPPSALGVIGPGRIGVYTVFGRQWGYYYYAVLFPLNVINEGSVVLGINASGDRLILWYGYGGLFNILDEPALTCTTLNLTQPELVVSGPNVLNPSTEMTSGSLSLTLLMYSKYYGYYTYPMEGLTKGIDAYEWAIARAIPLGNGTVVVAPGKPDYMQFNNTLIQFYELARGGLVKVPAVTVTEASTLTIPINTTVTVTKTLEATTTVTYTSTITSTTTETTVINATRYITLSLNNTVTLTVAASGGLAPYEQYLEISVAILIVAALILIAHSQPRRWP